MKIAFLSRHSLPKLVLLFVLLLVPLFGIAKGYLSDENAHASVLELFWDRTGFAYDDGSGNVSTIDYPGYRLSHLDLASTYSVNRDSSGHDKSAINTLAMSNGGSVFVSKYLASEEDAKYLVEMLDSSATSSWTDSFAISSNNPDSTVLFKLVEDSNGGFYMLYGDFVSATDHLNLKHYTSAGTSTSTELVSGSSVSFADMFMDSGALYVVWVNGDVYAQKYNSSDVAQWGSSGSVIESNANDKNSLVIAPNDSDGVLVLLYEEGNKNCISTSSSGSVATDNTFDFDMSGDYFLGVSDSSGGMNFAFEVNSPRDIHMNGIDSSCALKYVGSDGSGGWFDQSKTVVSSTDDQYLRGVVSDGSGGTIIAWDDQRDQDNGSKSGTSNDSDLYAQKLNSSGAVQWTSGGVELRDTATHQVEMVDSYISERIAYNNPVQTASDGTGGMYAFWVENEFGASVGEGNDANSIYYQHIMSDGSLQYGTTAKDIFDDQCNTNDMVATQPTMSVNSGNISIGWVFDSYNADTYSYTDNSSEDITSAYYGQKIIDAYQISSVTGGIDIEDTSGNVVETGSNYGVYGTAFTVRVKDTANGVYLTEVDVTASGDLSWNTLDGEGSLVDYKTVVANMTSQDSTGTSHALLVPRRTGDSAVHICPDASALTEVASDCTNGYSLKETDSNVTLVTLGSQEYWRVSGLTGTGGISMLGTFNLKDTMSRLKVSTAANHAIEFGSTYAVDAPTDNIIVAFDTAGQNFDLSTITVADLDLLDDDVQKSLCISAGTSCSPTSDNWGVTINTSTDNIIFIPPTGAPTTDNITAGSILKLNIGTNATSGANQITNPAVPEEYELYFKIETGETETGELTVYIVDDDSVDITGYIDTFLMFDIDTGNTINVDCDASGLSACDSHSGVSDNIGYMIDLGELTTTSLNKSGDNVYHADGLTGNINYLLMDLSSNASGGVVVTVQSAYQSLYYTATDNIPSVSNTGAGVAINPVTDSAYGMREVTNSATGGTFTIAGDYDGITNVYGGLLQTATEILNTTSNPIDAGRVEFQLAATPDASNAAGTYEDQLTFIATPTY